MTDQRIRRELRLLKGYALITTVMITVLTLSAFRRNSAHEKFTEIDVERINVVEPDGKYRFVISNTPRSIGPIYKGKAIGYPGGHRPGLIWFNDEGTENGGLGLGGSRNPDGTVDAATHMSFDQFDNDQVLNFDYRDHSGRRYVGISVLDRAPIRMDVLASMYDSLNRIADPAVRQRETLKAMATPNNTEPFAAQRVFLGRNEAKAAALLLSDRNGHPRIRLAVDSAGTPALEFLDDAGHVTSRYPEAKK